MTTDGHRQAIVIRVGPQPLDEDVFERIVTAFADFPAGTDFVLELSRLQRVDVRAVRRMVLLWTLSRQHRIPLHLVALSEPIHALLRLLSLDRLFLLHADMPALDTWLRMNRAGETTLVMSE